MQTMAASESDIQSQVTADQASIANLTTLTADLT